MDVTISGASSSEPTPDSPDVSGVGVAEINATNFPDSTFRNYVSSNFDMDGDGVLSAAEIADATNISVNSMGISSLKGIEYFTAVVELHCWDNI